MSNKLEFSDEKLIKYLKLSGKIGMFITDMIVNKIVRGYFEKEKIEIPIEKLQQSCDKYRASLNLYKASETLEWLKSLGLTVEDFEEYIETDLMLDQIMSELKAADNINAYFEENKYDFGIAEISYIVLSEKGQASLVLTEIDDGEDFAELAKIHSIDKKTGLNGGYVGFIVKNKIDEDLAEKIWSCEPEEVIGPIETENGFELIKVHSLKQAKELTEQIENDILNILFKKWLETKIKEDMA